MASIKRKLNELVNNFKSTPILFIGSGLSRRYLGLPDWKGLLETFANRINDTGFNYQMYSNRIPEDTKEQERLPAIATEIEKDYNKKWFIEKDIRKIDESYNKYIEAGISPFKVEIAYYLNNNFKEIQEYKIEIQKLKRLGEKSIASIITTNYDTFIDKLFKEYKVYVGQEELVSSNIYGIAEIYKIHGAVANPESIVITKSDYEKFNEKNAYLAAKLLTLFVEYPIIFIGYSIKDSNIRNILSSLVKCMSSDQLNNMQNTLIIIEYTQNNEQQNVENTSILIDQYELPITKITTNNFTILYDILATKKNKMPIKMLRFLKDSIYNYILTNKPTANIEVNIDDTRLNENSMAITIGENTNQSQAKKGLVGLESKDIFQDIVEDKLEWSADEILSEVGEALLKSNQIPVYKYLCSTNNKYPEITNYLQTKSTIKDNMFESLITNTIRKKRDNHKDIKFRNIKWITETYKEENKQVELMLHLKEDEINLNDLEKYLKDKSMNDFLDPNKKYISNNRKLIKIYDVMKYGREYENKTK